MKSRRSQRSPQAKRNYGVLVVLALAESVDARDARNDDDVAPFEQRLRRHEAQLLYALVDGSVLFDVNVGGGM